eukprot:CAMPEP_0181183454 /NCGR_PEP_ID=MMETSP1096-20121128/8436_1 /TAXON_ID=156174 ORGANISM="Chrysochromulina ericina, Strain CCMP281" /NCGR_SAMPLE_ID=MMETSP1096 /ASSEMBLY_ACC=CAM_ASM_000453 /LENGTH=126 /DNA_ID=CAMNT_0023272139 /DNA_START=702 /DNA_END=1082 /DNA_ORIENTATION=-
MVPPPIARTSVERRAARLLSSACLFQASADAAHTRSPETNPGVAMRRGSTAVGGFNTTCPLAPPSYSSRVRSSTSTSSASFLFSSRSVRTELLIPAMGGDVACVHSSWTGFAIARRSSSSAGVGIA